jgi:uncharacterized membrane protein
MGRINLIQCKIALGFVFSAVAVYFLGIKDHYGMLVWLHVFAGIVWAGLLYYFTRLVEFRLIYAKVSTYIF